MNPLRQSFVSIHIGSNGGVWAFKPLNQQVLKVGGFLGLAAYAPDSATGVLGRLLTLKAKHDFILHRVLGYAVYRIGWLKPDVLYALDAGPGQALNHETQVGEVGADLQGHRYGNGPGHLFGDLEIEGLFFLARMLEVGGRKEHVQLQPVGSGPFQVGRVGEPFHGVEKAVDAGDHRNIYRRLAALDQLDVFFKVFARGSRNRNIRSGCTGRRSQNIEDRHISSWRFR